MEARELTVSAGRAAFAVAAMAFIASARGNAIAEEPVPPPEPISGSSAAGSPVCYAVRYGPIDIAMIEVEGPSPSEAFRILITSSPGLPAPPFRIAYALSSDPGTGAALSFLSDSAGKNDRKRVEYAFDRRAALLRYTYSLEKRGKAESGSGSIDLDESLVDGISLLSRLAENAGSGTSFRLRFLGDRKTLPLELSFPGDPERLSMKNGVSVSAYRVNGAFTGEGVGALSGGFSLWISADERRLPLRASVKLPIGRATVEIKERKPGTYELASVGDIIED